MDAILACGLEPREMCQSPSMWPPLTSSTRIAESISSGAERRSAARQSGHDRSPGRLGERYPIISIEDGLAEDDWAGWACIDSRDSVRRSN